MPAVILIPPIGLGANICLGITKLRCLQTKPTGYEGFLKVVAEGPLNRIAPDLNGLEQGLVAAKPSNIAAAARSIELDTVFLLTNGGA